MNKKFEFLEKNLKIIEDSHKLENVQVKDRQEKEEREWAEKLERERSRTLNKVKLILELYFCSVVGFPISSHLFFKAYLVICIKMFLVAILETAHSGTTKYKL